MFYRKLGRTDLEVSNLGFGCMRLPHKEHFYEIDEAEATKMFDYAIEHGVNYFDTAYSFHSKNQPAHWFCQILCTCWEQD